MFDIATNDWDFPVELQPVFDARGIEIDGTSAVVRTDNHNVLGVHGSRYRLVPNSTIVESVIDAVKEANLSRDYDLKFYTADGGAKMRGEIMFNDLTVQPSVGDYVRFRVSFFNSYDGSWSFQANAEGLRLWCLNGCTTPDAVARSKFKHTQSINIEGTADKIGQGLNAFMQSPELWREWMRVQVSDEMAETFFKHTLAKSFTRQINTTKTNEKQLENLLGIWRNEKRELGANKWALYNAMTYWSSHTSDLKNPEVSRRNREDQIARTMSSNKWMEIA